MKSINLIKMPAVLLGTAFLFAACADTTTAPEEDHSAEVTMTYSPNPAITNTPIEFTFEVEKEGKHIAVNEIEVEVEKEGTGNHMEMMVMPHPSEVGHYEGSMTFTEAGHYEIHFKFEHDSKSNEKKFELSVQ